MRLEMSFDTQQQGMDRGNTSSRYYLPYVHVIGFVDLNPFPIAQRCQDEFMEGLSVIENMGMTH